MRRLAKISTIFATLLLCLLLTMTAALAASVQDGAKLLKAEQKAALEQKIQQIEHDHQVKVGIVTMKSLKGSSPSKMANTILDNRYAGGKNGSILLLLAMDSRDYHVSTNSAISSVPPPAMSAAARSIFGLDGEGDKQASILSTEFSSFIPSGPADREPAYMDRYCQYIASCCQNSIFRSC